MGRSRFYYGYFSASICRSASRMFTLRLCTIHRQWGRSSADPRDEENFFPSIQPSTKITRPGAYSTHTCPLQDRMWGRDIPSRHDMQKDLAENTAPTAAELAHSKLAMILPLSYLTG
ncbi:hypothetical protein MAP00_009197 [Monascus purpureus]|nr:hypothetical protein MAP00_009197 [Monascus purpureus]